MKYLPFLNGKYSTEPGLSLMTKAVHPEDGKVFQIDENYGHYLHNKQQCRNENISKYYCENILWPKTSAAVNWYIIQRLLKEYPVDFLLEKQHDNWQLTNKRSGDTFGWNKENELLNDSKYVSLFDALCCQVQEDVAICQINRGEDWLAAIHLCAPNHWAPHDKIGKRFNEVHAPVADMEKVKKHYVKMLETLVQKGPFTRFAWGIATDTKLNHHPVARPGSDEDEWQGRSVSADKFYIRTERQNMIGFPAENAFLFTIRTYFYEMDALDQQEKTALSEALENMSEAALAYKGLTDKVAVLQELLRK